MKPLLNRGKVFPFSTTLKQYDEHAEDESIIGNSGDGSQASNLMVIAEFRLKQDCFDVAKIINTEHGKLKEMVKAYLSFPSTDGNPARHKLRKELAEMVGIIIKY